MVDMHAAQRETFDFEECRIVAKEIFQFAGLLEEKSRALRGSLNFALGEWTGPWGREFTQRSREDARNMETVVARLRNDARGEWAEAHEQAATQWNNVAYAEAVMEEKRRIEGEHEREADERRAEYQGLNDFEAGVEELKRRFSAWWGGLDALAEALQNVSQPDDAPHLPYAPTFDPGNSFVYYHGTVQTWSGTEHGGPGQGVTDDEYGKTNARNNPVPAGGSEQEGAADRSFVEVTEVSRTSYGDDTGKCSINLDLVLEFLTLYKSERENLQSEYEAMAKAEFDGRNAIGKWGATISSAGIQAAKLYLGNLDAIYNGVAAVYNKLADGRSGVIVVDNATIDLALKDAGHDKPPGIIEVSAPAYHGIAPNSGWADDPVNASSGNFVYLEEDLALPGFANAIGVRRTYNAGRDIAGSFGPGWTSILDVSLLPLDDRVVLQLDDGAVLNIELSDGFGSYVSRRIDVQSTQSGFTVLLAEEDRWEFDSDGILVGGMSGKASWSVTREEAAITVSEALSGRRVVYEFNDDGRVVRAITSDGRVATWIYDDAGRCTSVDRPTGAITYEIDDGGRIAAVVDADGVEIVYNEYDSDGRVFTQKNPFGRVSEYQYDAAGSTRIVEAETRDLANLFVHDDTGNLLSLVATDGGTMRLSWDDRFRLAAINDRNGHTTSYEYLEGPRRELLTKVVGPDGTQQTLTWDDHERLIKIVDAGGGERRFEYEGDATLPSLDIQSDGGVTRYERDLNDLLTKLIDPDGVELSVSWDSDGQIDALEIGGKTTRFEYNSAGHLAATVDARGLRTDYLIDRAGRVTASANGTLRIDYIYTPAGRITHTFCDGEPQWFVEYGDHGEVVARTNSAGATTRFAYDSFGRCAQVTLPDSSTIANRFDGLSQLTGVLVNGLVVSSIDYDSNGNWIRVADADGVVTARTVDEHNRTSRIECGGNAVMEAEYHPSGHPSRVKELGVEYRFEVDEVGRPTRVVDSLGGEEILEYTPAGRLRSRTSPAGRRIDVSYNQAGDIEKIERTESNMAPHDGGEVVFNIDPLGRVTSWSHSGVASGGINWENNKVQIRSGSQDAARVDFNPLGLVASATDAAGSSSTFYRDNVGRITAVEGPAETVEFDYDFLSTAVRSSSGDEFSYQYSGAGRLQQIDVPGESPVTFTYDAGGDLHEVAVDDQHLVRFERSAVGNLESIVGRDGTSSFTYDALHRVTNLTSSLTGGTDYEYDADGVVTAMRSSAGHRIEMVRDDANGALSYRSDGFELAEQPTKADGVTNEAGQLVSGNDGRTLRYDEAGRLAEVINPNGDISTFNYTNSSMIESELTPSLGERRFTYAEARLVAVHADEGNSTFEYDNRGRRVGETRPDGSSRKYTWDPLDRLVALATTDAVGIERTRSFEYSGLGRLERIDGSIAVHWDDLVYGKPIAIGDRQFLRSGVSVCEVGVDNAWRNDDRYDVYGHDPQQSINVDLGYRGELTVDGLVFMGARVYDPNTRCFLSRDPLPGVFANVGGANPYNYAGSDPVNRLDPTGLRPLTTDEFDAWKDRQTKSRLDAFTSAITEDPWGSLALAVVVVAAVVVVVATGGTGLAAIAAMGFLFGAGMNAAAGFHNKDFEPRRAIADGVISAAAAFAGGVVAGKATSYVGSKFAGPAGSKFMQAVSKVAPKAANTLGGATTGAIEGGANEFADQVINPYTGAFESHRIDVGSVVKETWTGGATSAVSGVIGETISPGFKKLGATDDFARRGATFASSTGVEMGEQYIDPCRRIDIIDASATGVKEVLIDEVRHKVKKDTMRRDAEIVNPPGEIELPDGTKATYGPADVSRPPQESPDLPETALPEDYWRDPEQSAEFERRAGESSPEVAEMIKELDVAEAQQQADFEQRYPVAAANRNLEDANANAERQWEIVREEGVAKKKIEAQNENP